MMSNAPIARIRARNLSGYAGVSAAGIHRRILSDALSKELRLREFRGGKWWS